MTENNPAADPSLTDVIRGALTSRLLETYIHLPGTVDSYSNGKAGVQINIKKKHEGGTTSLTPIITDVPVLLPRSNGGDSYLQLPIKRGDTGLLAFSQRSMDEWLVKGGNVVPKSTRMNDVSDAIFFPGLYPFNNTVSEDNDNVVLKNNNMSIVLHPGGQIEIKGAAAEVLSILDEWMTEVTAGTMIVNVPAATAVWNPITIGKLSDVQLKLSTLIP